MGSGLDTPAAAVPGAEGVPKVSAGSGLHRAVLRMDGLRNTKEPSSANTLSASEGAATCASLALLFKDYFSSEIQKKIIS